MSVIDYYAHAYKDVVVTQVLPTSTSTVTTEKRKDFRLLDDSKVVTFAEFDPVSKDAITAHKLRDYRRKVFNMTLLPEIHLPLDSILEGSTYWNEKLHNESPYS